MRSKYHVRFSCKCQLKWKSMACSNSSTTLESTSRRLIRVTTTAQTIEFCLPRSFIMSISCSFFGVFSSAFVSMCRYYRALLEWPCTFQITNFTRCAIAYAYSYYAFVIPDISCRSYKIRATSEQYKLFDSRTSL